MARFVALVPLLFYCAAGHAQTVAPLPAPFHPDSTPLVIFAPGAGGAPPGAVNFCLSQPEDCQTTDAQALVETADGDDVTRFLAQTVNLQVNKAIWSDARWGKQPGLFAEWKVSPESGVCHDYAVTKLDLLLKAGIERDSLSLAWLRVAGASHLVLLVKIDGVIFVLDNLNDTLRNVSDVPPNYVWISRQAWNTPLIWVAMVN